MNSAKSVRSRLGILLENLRLRRAALALAFLFALIILVVCLLPGKDLPETSLTDKTEHFIAYLGLSAPLAIALGRGRLLLAFVIAAAFGAGVEVLQAIVPTDRSASGLDGLADAIGAGLGSGIIGMLRQWAR